jgi:hypothetical protein
MPDIFDLKPSPELPQILRATIEENFPEADTRPINPRGLIRVGYSYNEKARLYKIPLKADELWFISGEKVQKLAENSRRELRPKPFELPKQFPNLVVKPKVQEVEQIVLRPTRKVTCVQEMYAAGPVEGTRHERMLRITSSWKREGFPQQAAVDALIAWGKGSLTDYEIEKVVQDIYHKDYVYSCDDIVMKQFCDSMCIFASRKDYAPGILTAHDIEKQYASFLKSDWKDNSLNMCKLMNTSLAEQTDWWIMPEHVVGIIGPTGINKTSFLQNIAVNIPIKFLILYISTEFSNDELLRRFIQIAHGMSKQEVMEYYELSDNTKADAIRHIKFVRSTPDLDTLISMVHKQRPRILMIDTIDDIIKERMRGLESEDLVRRQLKDISRKYRLITFAVHHISKAAAYDELGRPKALNINSGKGSSTFEQKADIVFGINGIQKKEDRLITTLKSRDNPYFEYLTQVNMNTFRFKEMVK